MIFAKSTVRRRSGSSCALLLLLAAFSGQPAPAQAAPTFDQLSSNATAAREQGDNPRAIELYRKALALNPQWPDGWWYLGTLQYAGNAFAAAEDALTHYLHLTPKGGPAWALRGLCEYEMHNYAQALKDIQHGIALGAANQSHNEAILRYHEGLLLTLNGSFEAALHTYAFFAKDPSPSPQLLAAIGLAGLRIPRQPADLAPEERELPMLAGRAALHLMANDTKNAQQEFEQLFARFPSAPNAHYLYGYLLSTSDPTLAVEQFKDELKVAPSNAGANAMLAWIALMRNEPASALPYARSAAVEAPSLFLAQLVLGRSLVETGDPAAGIPYLKKALELDPGNLEPHLTLASAYSMSGQAEQARQQRLLCLQMTKPEEAPVAQP